MNVSLTLPESIVDWANTQEDIQKAILDVLEKNVLSLNPATINAIKLLKKNSVILPKGMEFQIQQIIGTDGWNALNRSERLSLGRKVKSSPNTYGLEFARTNTANHALYIRM